MLFLNANFYACYGIRNISIIKSNFIVLNKCSYKADVWYYLSLTVIKDITMDILFSFQRAQKCEENTLKSDLN